MIPYKDNYLINDLQNKTSKQERWPHLEDFDGSLKNKTKQQLIWMTAHQQILIL